MLLTFTKLFYKDERLIIRPLDCRRRPRLKFTERLTTGHHCRFDWLCKDEDNQNF